MNIVSRIRSLFTQPREPCMHYDCTPIGKVRRAPGGRRVEAMKCKDCGSLIVKPNALRIVR